MNHIGTDFGYKFPEKDLKELLDKLKEAEGKIKYWKYWVNKI
jgi:hypothetical protein